MGLLNQEDAVPDLFFQFNPVRGKVGEPLPVGHVAKAVLTGLKPGPGDPPPVALVPHGNGVVLPVREIPGEMDALCAGPEEPELDLAVVLNACHRATPFVMMQYKARATSVSSPTPREARRRVVPAFSRQSQAKSAIHAWDFIRATARFS